MLGTLLHSGYSDMAMNATFISMTFVGMIIGSFAAGFLGDHFGRSCNFHFNVALFGIASRAAAFSPGMQWLVAFRLIMGIGLAAEIVIGYETRRPAAHNDPLRPPDPANSVSTTLLPCFAAAGSNFQALAHGPGARAQYPELSL